MAKGSSSKTRAGIEGIVFWRYRGIEGTEENMCIFLDTGIEGIEGPNL